MGGFVSNFYALVRPRALLFVEPPALQRNFALPEAHPIVSSQRVRLFPAREHATPRDDADLSIRWSALIETLLD